MPVTLGTNIASLKGQRQLGQTTDVLTRTFERLASGQRINRASDDAAGLAIASDLNAKVRVYGQAIRNGNDGISALTIADSALEGLSSVVIRIRELAEQSANGTYSDKQRKALDNEAQALKAEFFRISKTTSFNGVNLFDGSLGSGLRLQLGYGANGSINASVGGAIGTGTFGASTSFATETYSSYAVSLGDLNGDGILDLVTAGYSSTNDSYTTIRLGTGSGTFGAARSYLTLSGDQINALALGDLNGDGKLDIVSVGTNSRAFVQLGTGNGTFGTATSFASGINISYGISLGDLNGDGILDLVTAGTNTFGGPPSDGYAAVCLGTGAGTFGAARSYITEGNRSYAVTLGDLNGDGILDLVTAGYSDTGGGNYVGDSTVRLGTGSGTFGAATSYRTEGETSKAVTLGDLNGDGLLDLVTAGYYYDGSTYRGYSTVRLGVGNGSFGSATSFSAEDYLSNAVNLSDLNGDGFLDLITAGESQVIGSTTVRLGTGRGSFGAAASFDTTFRDNAVAIGDINGDGVLDVVSAGLGIPTGSAAVLLGVSVDGVAPLLDFSLKTKISALQAMGPLQRAQENLAKQRGVIGANQSRVNIALNNLGSGKENYSAAESRIKDADIASESAQLTRSQILQRAAASVLAQANQQPGLALRLLPG